MGFFKSPEERAAAEQRAAGLGFILLGLVLIALMVSSLGGCAYIRKIQAADAAAQERERQEAQQRAVKAAQRREQQRQLELEHQRLLDEKEAEIKARLAAEETEKNEAKRAAAKAEAERKQKLVERAVIESKVASTKFPAHWGAACNNITDMHIDRCSDGNATKYQVGRCLELQRAAIKRGTLFLMPNILRRTSYNSRTKRFTIVVGGHLTGDLEHQDCLSETCISDVIVTRRPPSYKGKARPLTWYKRHLAWVQSLTKPIATIHIPAAKVPDPTNFAETVHVYALVRPTARNNLLAGDVYMTHWVQVKVEGLWVGLPDLSWGKLVKRGPKKIKNCR
ncbi:MAG: hypothetical protein ACPGQD_06140 [Planctomycetota bacterium]